MKNLSLVNVDDFITSNLESIEVMSENILSTITDSIISSNIKSLEESLKGISKNSEKIFNILDLEEEQNKICFCWGRISAATDIALDLINEDKNSDVFENLIKSYSLLVPALKIIKKYNTVPGIVLQKEMNLKSSSNLSNFLNRIKKYELISIHKIGTCNYLSLTVKGEQLLTHSQNEGKCIESTTPEINDLYKFLDQLTGEMVKPVPNSIRVLSNIDNFDVGIREKRLLKKKIDQLFIKRDEYFKTIFKNVCTRTSRSDFYYGYFDTESNSEKNFLIYDTKFNTSRGV